MTESVRTLQQYADVLDLRAAPTSASDHSVNAFFDMGAWHGYSLPSSSMARDSGKWMSARFARLRLQVQRKLLIMLAAHDERR